MCNKLFKFLLVVSPLCAVCAPFVLIFAGVYLGVAIIEYESWNRYLENKPLEVECYVYDYSIYYDDSLCQYDCNNCGGNVDTDLDNDRTGIECEYCYGNKYRFWAIADMTTTYCDEIDYKEVLSPWTSCGTLEIAMDEYGGLNNTVTCWIPNNCNGNSNNESDDFYVYDYERPCDGECDGLSSIIKNSVIVGIFGCILVCSCWSLWKLGACEQC